MTRLLVLLIALGLAGMAFANEDLAPRGIPTKGMDHVGMNPGTPDEREGGETIGSAFVIPGLPFSDNGNTCDNIHDYDEVCNYSGSLSPDVVYSYLAMADEEVMVDLCLSTYDTKVYVYENMWTPNAPYACNDDFYFGDPPECGTYTSYVEFIATPGNTYYIVVDGYGSDCGNYVIDITSQPNIPCLDVTCHEDAVDEEEPPLVAEYTDMYNGGCNSTPNVFQTVDWIDMTGCAHIAGVSGWYPVLGAQNRDTDWYEVTAAGFEITVKIETDNDLTPTRCMMTSPFPSCAGYTYSFQSSVIEGCTEYSWTVPTNPLDRYWIFVAPAEWIDGPIEFKYCLEICGIQYTVIPNEAATWGSVKTMYR